MWIRDGLVQMLRGFSGDAAASEPVFSEPHHHSYQTKALIGNRPDQSTPGPVSVRQKLRHQNQRIIKFGLLKWSKWCVDRVDRGSKKVKMRGLDHFSHLRKNSSRVAGLPTRNSESYSDRSRLY